MLIFRDNRERKNRGDSVLSNRVGRAALKKQKWSGVLGVWVQDKRGAFPHPAKACGFDRRCMCSPDGWYDFKGSSLSWSLVCGECL